MDDLEASSSNDSTDLTHSRSFSDYACCHWDSHAREVDHESELTDLIVFILKAELGPRKFFLARFVSKDLKSPDISPLYLAAFLGLYWPCKKLAQSGTDGNEKWGYWGTALHVAISCSNEKLVRFLPHHGADVNARGEIFGSPLQCAIGVCSSLIVQLLLHHRADVVSEVGYYDTSLTSAMQRGKSEIAIMLLEHGAVMSKFGGGIEAGEALARNDFRKFVDIQVEVLLQKEREKART
jgi:ankyrin repeat protein